MRVEHWSTAAEQGARAARNAVAPADARPCTTVPYSWSDWYGSRIQFAGVAAGDGLEIVSGDPAGDHFVALYREGDRLTGVLTPNGQRHVMEYRRLIAQRARFDEAVAFARTSAPVRPATTTSRTPANTGLPLEGRDSHDRIAATRHDGRRPHDLALRHGAHP
ncbi:oxidoreductase C-terminal domain-containing protein [Saccharothrix sp. BKS2]|uniref:oxidoreductase C-terminal domain-containing protein n=1 Tax=Saccharothrix sp. BKS2 TaxID=3064400 RepID=UPI0039ECAF16